MKKNSKIFFAPEYITAKNKFSAYYAENILPVLHRIEQRRKNTSVYFCCCAVLLPHGSGMCFSACRAA